MLCGFLTGWDNKGAGSSTQSNAVAAYGGTGASYGNKGGTTSFYHAGGGGGGAGGEGSTGNTNKGGNGGAGILINIDGNSWSWGCGGGGNAYGDGTHGVSGDGGVGGGGVGGYEPNTHDFSGRTCGAVGVGGINSGKGCGWSRNYMSNDAYTERTGGAAGANTGCGGGGSAQHDGWGGAGGSGIVIVRFLLHKAWKSNTPQRPTCEGGCEVTSATIDGTQYKIFTFKSDGVFNILEDGLVYDYLVVGGGGSGGGRHSGGGGAGGVVHVTGASIAPGRHTIVIGAGGAQTQTDYQGNHGRDTYAFQEAGLGGGTSGAYVGGVNSYLLHGGSGCGASDRVGNSGKGFDNKGGGVSTQSAAVVAYGGTGTSYGNKGGTTDHYHAGGGGGGAGGPGSTGNTNKGGNGGPGVQINIARRDFAEHFL